MATKPKTTSKTGAGKTGAGKSGAGKTGAGKSGAGTSGAGTAEGEKSGPKATPAGPKRRGAGSRDAASDQRPHLRAVETAVDPVDADEGATTEAGDAGDASRFKRADLIEAVCDRTSLKRADAKVVLDLVLEELGRALDRTDELILPPLGKLSVKRRKPDAKGPEMLTLKLRRSGPATAKADESPLADPDEDG